MHQLQVCNVGKCISYKSCIVSTFTHKLQQSLLLVNPSPITVCIIGKCITYNSLHCWQMHQLSYNSLHKLLVNAPPTAVCIVGKCIIYKSLHC